MELNNILFLLSLTKDQISNSNIVSFEYDYDTLKLIARKEVNNRNVDNYVEYSIKNNDSYISITKRDNESEVYYDFCFYNIINRYFCEVYIDSKKNYRYEFNYDVLSKRDNFNDAIKSVDIASTKRR